MVAMSLPEGWRAGVPIVHIPRHPLWIDAYEGAWDVLERWAAQPGAPRLPEAAANLHYARYAFAALPLHDWLDQQYDERLSPLHAWSEWSLFQVTGDTARLARALPALLGQFFRLRTTRRRVKSVGRSAWAGGQDGSNGPADGQDDSSVLHPVWAGRGSRRAGDLSHTRQDRGADSAGGLYYCTEGECEMDQLPRAPYGWIDLTAQQAMAVEHCARMARAVGAGAEAENCEAEWRALRSLIEQRCWDDSSQFYTDCGRDGTPQAVKTVAGLWPLLAGVPSPERAQRLAAHLSEPGEFWRVHVFAGLSADHPRYSDRGDRWRGAVWPFHNYAIIKGLERYGLHDLARRAADNHITTISHVYKETRSHWDYYAPDYIEPGSTARHDAAGTGVSAVALLLETILGFNLDAPAHTLHWRPTLCEAYDVDRLRIGSALLSLHVTPEPGNPGRVQAALRASEPLTLHLSTPEGEQWVEVENEVSLSVLARWPVRRGS